MRVSPLFRLRPAHSLALRASPSLGLRASQAVRMPQDMPPEAGYDPVQYKRNLPARGFRPVYYIIGMTAIMVYGFYRYSVGIKEWNELAREKMWSRIHLIPLLQAEEDRDQVRRHYANIEREKDLLGAEHKVYHSDRFVRPTYSAAPPPDKK